MRIVTALLLAVLPFTAMARVVETDICVYGATSGGVAAAVQAARMGKSVVLLESSKHLGGLTTGGLGATDIGNKIVIGGIAREFYQRLGTHYGTNEMWTFEPYVAKNTFIAMLRGAKVPVHFEQHLASVRKRDNRITEIAMENGDTFRAAMFIDATYEGDLMAKAKVSYTVGREANSQYNETLNGVRANTPQHQFSVNVDPYIRRGEPKSGLLPFIQSGSGGKPGSGDRCVQAYNFRLCLTQNETNRLPILPPKNYDEKQFELLARYFEALVAEGETPELNDFWLLKWMPNGKTDINNRGGFSTDAIGMNWDYPEADYKKRAQIWQAHEDYTRGFLHFLATSQRVPEKIRAEMKTWGLCRDEFTDNGGWMTQLYVREARRMVSDYVMTEHHCRGLEIAPDSVGMGAYGMDSHNCQRIVKHGYVENEGDVQVHGFTPYPISYRSIVPAEKQCANLLVPVCMSATHIAYGSIRMEPVFIVLGQSAATAASMAIDSRVPVQKVDYAVLRSRLVADKQVLDWTGPVKRLSVKTIEPHKVEGIVMDDFEAKRRGPWHGSTASRHPILGASYQHDGNTNKGKCSMTFTPDIPKTGLYEVAIWFQVDNNRATNVPVSITVSGEVVHRAQVNQTIGMASVLSLGKFKLPKGRETSVKISNEGTSGYVVVDGLQIVPAR